MRKTELAATHEAAPANTATDASSEVFDTDVLVKRYPATFVAFSWLKDAIEKHTAHTAPPAMSE